MLAGSILGGSRSIYGAIVGAAIMQLGPNSISSLGNYALVVYGAFLIVMAVVLPGGGAGLARAGARRLRRRLGVDEPRSGPELVAPGGRTYRAGERCDVPAQAVHSARMGPQGCRYLIGEK